MGCGNSSSVDVKETQKVKEETKTNEANKEIQKIFQKALLMLLNF